MCFEGCLASVMSVSCVCLPVLSFFMKSRTGRSRTGHTQLDLSRVSVLVRFLHFVIREIGLLPLGRPPPRQTVEERSNRFVSRNLPYGGTINQCLRLCT